MNKIRVRFAPAPSGFMHIGNLRSAIVNYLYAKQENGDFVLRLEDTDQSRTDQLYVNKIYDSLSWAGITPDESSLVGGPYAPYIQSQRAPIYKKYLNLCIEKNLVYRCFATVEELEQIKFEQQKLGLPPRYVRNRFMLTAEQEQLNLDNGKPFVWRFKLPQGKTEFIDKVRGKMNYDLSHFADFPITRENQTFTFIFANFVDDVEMKINYVMRGEEHLSNTVLQSAIYDLLNLEKPSFYHLPLICDKQGKKLSKRDFGFSLEDLIQAGYISEAIVNYLLLIGSSFEEEIFTLEEAAAKKYFEKFESRGSIKYDIDKLMWVNALWLKRLETSVFLEKLKIFISIDLIQKLPFELWEFIKNESKTLKEAILYADIFLTKTIEKKHSILHLDFIKKIIELNRFNYSFLIEELKKYAKDNEIPSKELWRDLRVALTQQEHGMSLKIIVDYLMPEILIDRLKLSIN
jgi:nondiscriminating glutamyl-tRNA synthetase